MRTGDLVRVETEIGYYVVRAWVTEGIRPGIVACSHHMGRWKTHENGQRQMMATVKLDHDGTEWGLKREKGAEPYESSDRGHAAHLVERCRRASEPDFSGPSRSDFRNALLASGGPRAQSRAGDKYGDIHVDTAKSREVYKKWLAMTRPADKYSPDGTRRPYWMLRPLKPAREFYKLPAKESLTERSHGERQSVSGSGKEDRRSAAIRGDGTQSELLSAIDPNPRNSTELPESLGKLTQLQSLDLSGQPTDGAAEVAGPTHAVAVAGPLKESTNGAAKVVGSAHAVAVARVFQGTN